MKEELGLDPLRGTILARRSPSCAYDYDRLRLPPASPARNSKAGKKESTGRRLSQLCPQYATPSSNSSLDYRRSDARIVENGFATSGGLSKSAKVVLAAPLWGVGQRIFFLHDGRTTSPARKDAPLLPAPAAP